jgi:aspartyl/asparaginyl beta-hydroxylase (cupin superfamily)
VRDFSEIQALNRAAVQAMAARDIAGAEALLARALALDDANLQSWLNLAAARRGGGRPELALAALDQALRVDPRCFLALLMKGALQDQLSRARAAAETYRLAIGQAPPDDELDPPTLRALHRAREVDARHKAELREFLRDRLHDDAGVTSKAALARAGIFVDLALGLRSNYRQEPTHLFYPGLPAIEFYDRDLFPWLDDIEAAAPAMQREALDVLEQDRGLVPYMDYPDNVPLDQWEELNRSDRWSAFHLIANGTLQRANAARCPATMAALAKAPQPHVSNRSPASMFSLLKPRTRIPPHHGVANTRLVVHVPLVVPPGCRFRVGGQTRPWEFGRAWVFDDTIEHEAWNDSDAPRLVLIFDIWSPFLTEDDRHAIATILTGMDKFTDSPVAMGGL